MKIALIAVAACATLAAHGPASATVLISATVYDTPAGLEKLTEERPISHSLSLIKNGTSVSASGDISTGVLRAVAISRIDSADSNDRSAASTGVTARDLITFAKGASGTAYLDWGFDGSLDVDPNYRNKLGSDGGAYLNFNLNPPSGGLLGYRLATVTTGTECSGASAPNCVTGAFSHVEVAMRGSVPFEISPGTFTLEFSLGAFGQGGDRANYGNTTYLYLRMPAGADFTSASGVFMANALPVPPPVPEPTTALLIACGGLTLIATRRWGSRPALPAFW